MVEFVSVEPLGETLMPSVEMEDAVLAHARTQPCTPWAHSSGLTRRPAAWRRGSVKSEIVRVARERQATSSSWAAGNVTGCRSCVELTEDTVLHAAPCDVLAMRAGRRLTRVSA